MEASCKTPLTSTKRLYYKILHTTDRNKLNGYHVGGFKAVMQV